jgi:hypothetical protein
VFHNVQYFGQYSTDIFKFSKKAKFDFLHLVEMDTDPNPDRQALVPDPAK